MLMRWDSWDYVQLVVILLLYLGYALTLVQR